MYLFKVKSTLLIFFILLVSSSHTYAMCTSGAELEKLKELHTYWRVVDAGASVEYKHQLDQMAKKLNSATERLRKSLKTASDNAITYAEGGNPSPGSAPDILDAIKAFKKGRQASKAFEAAKNLATLSAKQVKKLDGKVEQCEKDLQSVSSSGGVGAGADNNPDVQLGENLGGGLNSCSIQDSCVSIPDDHIPPDPVGSVTVEDGVSNEELCRVYRVNC